VCVQIKIFFPSKKYEFSMDYLCVPLGGGAPFVLYGYLHSRKTTKFSIISGLFHPPSFDCPVHARQHHCPFYPEHDGRRVHSDP
jgi:hypothetical protein